MGGGSSAGDQTKAKAGAALEAALEAQPPRKDHAVNGPRQRVSADGLHDIANRKRPKSTAYDSSRPLIWVSDREDFLHLKTVDASEEQLALPTFSFPRPLRAIQNFDRKVFGRQSRARAIALVQCLCSFVGSSAKQPLVIVRLLKGKLQHGDRDLSKSESVPRSPRSFEWWEHSAGWVTRP